MSSPKPNPDNKEQIELLKQEYKMAAERYENIYKAVWQIFQYLAALSAAIFAFGGRLLPSLPLWSISILASVPLIFWYFVTFLPLNRYGDEVAKRLALIEKSLNNLVFGPQPDKSSTSKDNTSVGIDLYTNFQKRLIDTESTEKKEGCTKIIFGDRVRERVWRFGAIFIGLLVIVSIFNTAPSPSEAQRNALVEIQKSLRTITANQEEIINLKQLLEEQLSDNVAQEDSVREEKLTPPPKMSVSDSNKIY